MKVHVAGEDIEELAEGALGSDLAKKIKKNLQGSPLAIKINGAVKDLTTPLRDGDTVSVLTFEDREGKEIFWHSSAHVLAQAIQRLYPEAKPTIGPPIEVGFYYDFADLEISEYDFPKIEEEMKKIVNGRFVPQRIEYQSEEEALEVFQDNPFKRELIQSFEEGSSAYQQGEFIDLCRGPHVPNLGLIQAFKILKTSGAYWRAQAENPQLTRIYAVSYPDKKELKAYLRMLEEAKKRDHRILGKTLNLFSFQEEAPGMPFFHPKGMILWEELMKFWDEHHKRADYIQIKTPLLMSRDLWEKSGHWKNYRENMYTSNIDEKEYAVKPMNCPGCMLYFKNGQYSYRQLPLRIAEIGHVHRHELSGALSGLFRVRGFHQDDSHIFMKPEDISSEILGVLRLAETMYARFELEFHLELSTRPEKSIGTDEQWEQATNGLKEALEQGEYEYVMNEGDGAFYGPKIDMHIHDAIGRTWQCGTIQLDMNLPERFDVHYDAADGSKQRPVMIHRVVYGSIERFIGILIEHYAGKFPLWLNPNQIKILPIADRHVEYSERLAEQFKKNQLRVEVDSSSESVSKKVRNAILEHFHYALVVGDKEIERNLVTVRYRNQVIGAIEKDDFLKAAQEENRNRSSQSPFKSHSKNVP